MGSVMAEVAFKVRSSRSRLKRENSRFWGCCNPLSDRFDVPGRLHAFSSSRSDDCLRGVSSHGFNAVLFQFLQIVLHCSWVSERLSAFANGLVSGHAAHPRMALNPSTGADGALSELAALIKPTISTAAASNQPPLQLPASGDVAITKTPEQAGMFLQRSKSRARHCVPMEAGFRIWHGLSVGDGGDALSCSRQPSQTFARFHSGHDWRHRVSVALSLT